VSFPNLLTSPQEIVTLLWPRTPVMSVDPLKKRTFHVLRAPEETPKSPRIIALPAKIGLRVATVAGIVMLGAGVSNAQATPGNPAPEHKIWICHATSSDTNPYEIINVDVASTKYEGHLAHKTDPNKQWKSDGTFGGLVHVDGQAKPDIIGTPDAESAPAECFDSEPPVTTSTTSTTTTTTPPGTTTTTTPPVVPTTTEPTVDDPGASGKTPPSVSVLGASESANPLPNGASAGQASAGSQPVYGGLAAFASFLALGAALVSRRRRGVV